MSAPPCFTWITNVNYVSGLPDPRYPGLHRGLSISVGGVLVNTNGVEFLSDDMTGAEGFRAAVSQPKSTYWRIFDERQSQGIWVSGTGWANRATVQRVLLGDTVLIKRAPTLAQLAQVTGLPIEGLTKTVAAYNENHKNKMQSPPFYAAQLFPLARKSMGGIMIDHQAGVLDNHFVSMIVVVLERFAEELTSGALLVVDENRSRVRILPMT